VAAALILAHVLVFTVLGGAVLNRYLLPVLPIVFAAMAASIAILPSVQRAVVGAVLLAGMAASNFINPPYPFPYEENLAFTDFIRLHSDAADYLAHWYDDPVVHTAWPMSGELSRPDLGYVSRPIRVQSLPNMSLDTLESLDWSKVQVLVVFSQNWDPKINLMRVGPLLKFWETHYNFVPNATPEEARARIPFPVAQSFTRGGQWVDIYVNPDLPRVPRVPAPVAAVR
jgi:hypothetical protein